MGEKHIIAEFGIVCSGDDEAFRKLDQIKEAVGKNGINTSDPRFDLTVSEFAGSEGPVVTASIKVLVISKDDYELMKKVADIIYKM